MNKKVLVVFPHQLKQRHGGPYSMLYHFREGLKQLQHNVDFLCDFVDYEKQQPTGKTKTSSLKQTIASVLPKSLLDRRKVKLWWQEVALLDNSLPSAVDVSAYDILHFHETLDVWRYRDLLTNYKGQVVLTSHSPKPYHLELIEDVFQSTKQLLGSAVWKELEEIDRFAYKRADDLLFPCREATESYVETWDLFQQISQDKKTGFVTTGVIPSHCQLPPEEIRRRYNIPANAFVITFVGRKIAVKGFDMLLEAAKTLLKKNPLVYFIVVGKKNNGQALKHPRFIETGWTDDPFSFIQAGDLHVVPNRQTNFDLNVLEVLSLGKPVLLSETGGNKYFRQFAPNGIFYHGPNTADLVAQIEYCFATKNLASLGEQNRQLYTAFFTAEKFAAQQLEFYKSI